MKLMFEFRFENIRKHQPIQKLAFPMKITTNNKKYLWHYRYWYFQETLGVIMILLFSLKNTWNSFDILDHWYFPSKIQIITANLPDVTEWNQFYSGSFVFLSCDKFLFCWAFTPLGFLLELVLKAREMSRIV